MQTILYTTPVGFQELRQDWNDLLERSLIDVPFLRWEWQHAWWTHLGEGELCLLAVRADDGCLVGLAPLFRLDAITHVSLNTIGCTQVSDYLDVIVARGCETPVYAAFLDALAGLAWDTWEMCNLPAASPTRQLLPAAARARGYHVEETTQQVCPIIDLPPTWDEYLAGLNKKERHELRRKLRRAEQAGGVTHRILSCAEPLDMDAFIDLLKSHPEKADFMDEPMRAFFHAVGAAAQRAGWLQMAFLEIDGQQAAAYMNFDYNGRIMVYNSGLDTTRFGALSPGIVLAGRLIRHAIEQGRETFDFMRGDEVYKYRLGARDTWIYHLCLQRRHESQA